ncbi:MAG: hypothetical protein ABIJ35_09945 [Acidobacteriota bacterium]
METKQKQRKALQKLLYRSFDADLSPEESARLDRGLKASETFRREKDTVEKIRSALATGKRPGFKPNFSERVLHRIQKPAGGNGLDQLYRSFRQVFSRLAVAGTVLLFFLLLYNIHLGDNLSTEEVHFASDSTVQEIMNVPLF